MTKQASANKKEKTIIEIFYDEWDNEIKPDNPDYKKYLNGDEYYGSYFVDQDGNIVKEMNPSKEEDLERKKEKRAEKSKKEVSEDATTKDIIKAIAIAVAIAISLIAGWFLIKEIVIPLLVVILFFCWLLGKNIRGR